MTGRRAMKKWKALCSAALVIVLAVLLKGAVSPGMTAEEPCRKTLFFDAHCDTALRIQEDGIDPGILSKSGHLDIPRQKEGGIAWQVFALWIHPSNIPDHAARRTLQLLEAVRGSIERNSGSMGLALTVEEAMRISGEGRIAAFIAIEGGEAIENDCALLRVYHRLGVRSMTITWCNNTPWADASMDTVKLGGLSDFGRDVIHEMNRLGMVIDISHASSGTVRDILAATDRPVVASHSCCRALCNHVRNLTDDELRALASNGGVIGINFAPEYLCEKYREGFQRAQKELKPAVDALKEKYRNDRKAYVRERNALYSEKMKSLPRATLLDVTAHIDHAVKVAGIDHVGIGSDFDGIDATPEGLEDCSKLQAIALQLRKTGYSAEDIEKISHRNFLRVYRDVIGR
jgi:membrane dipeptidase